MRPHGGAVEMATWSSHEARMVRARTTNAIEVRHVMTSAREHSVTHGGAHALAEYAATEDAIASGSDGVETEVGRGQSAAKYPSAKLPGSATNARLLPTPSPPLLQQHGAPHRR